jgi:hypothetical protein
MAGPLMESWGPGPAGRFAPTNVRAKWVCANCEFDC